MAGMTVRLATTYRQPGASRFGRPGGAWDVPGLDRLLDSVRVASAPAVVDGDVTLDHGTLDALASRAAGGLRALGVRRGDVVAWQTPNWWEAVVLFHACWRSGAVAAPVHHQVGAREVARMMDDLAPTVTLSAPDLPLAGLVDAIGVRTGDPRFEALAGRAADPGVAPGVRRRRGAVHLGLDGQSRRRCCTPTGAWPTRRPAWWRPTA